MSEVEAEPPVEHEAPSPVVENESPAEEQKKSAVIKRGTRLRTGSEAREVVFESAIDEVIKVLPGSVGAFFKKMEPIIFTVTRRVNHFAPHISRGFNAIVNFIEWFYYKILPYEPELLFPMAFGIFMIFFGGSFMLLIACVEAYRICGWQQTRDHLVTLYRNYLVVKKASDEDDQVDDNHDGIADVLQISEKELITRKIKVFLRSSDPEAMGNALNGIYAGALAVAATLRVEFARTLALGVAIGDVLSVPGLKLLVPAFNIVVPKDYQKWVPVILRYVFKSIGVSIALTIERYLCAVHSAIRGSQLFITSLNVWMTRRNYNYINNTASLFAEEAVMCVVAVLGVWIQIQFTFGLPFPLNILLFPFTLFETFLSIWLTYVAT